MDEIHVVVKYLRGAIRIQRLLGSDFLLHYNEEMKNIKKQYIILCLILVANMLYYFKHVLFIILKGYYSTAQILPPHPCRSRYNYYTAII